MPVDLLALKRSTLPMGDRKYGGGGGGDGGYAERQAQMKAEQDQAIRQINTIFGKGDDYDPVTSAANAAERDRLYSTISSDASTRLLDRLNTDRGIAERGTRFQLARQGLAGGSADIDQNAEILRKFNEGSLEIGNSATTAANNARIADEQTRVNIINNIRNGMAANDAISASFAGLQNNANQARDAAMATTIGGFFDDINNWNAQRQYQIGAGDVRTRYGGAGLGTSGSTGGYGGRITK